MRGHPRSHTALVFTLLLCLLSAGLDSVNISDDVVDAVDVQEAVAVDCTDDALIVSAVAQPQPSADDYDSRLYRADLARAKRWGS